MGCWGLLRSQRSCQAAAVTYAAQFVDKGEGRPDPVEGYMFALHALRTRSLQWIRHVSLLMVVLSCSVVLNVTLAREVFALREAISYIKDERRLKIGDRVEPLRGVDMAGHDSVISYASSGSTLVYFISPTCIWCKRNQKSFLELVAELPQKTRVVVASVGNGPLDQLVAGLPAHITALGRVTGSFDFKVSGTPQTVLYSRA